MAVARKSVWVVDIFTADAPAVSAGSVVVPKARGIEPLIAILRDACR